MKVSFYQQNGSAFSPSASAVARFMEIVDFPSSGNGLVTRRLLSFPAFQRFCNRIRRNLNRSAPRLRGSA